MRVLHINTLQEGGAALCAIRINNALKNEGLETQMLFGEGDHMPQNVDGAIAMPDKHFWSRSPFLSRLVLWMIGNSPFGMNAEKLQRIFGKASKKYVYFHIPLSNYKNISDHPLVDWADIIHLHWVSGFVDYPTFFRKVNKPIVWTLHDKYPAVGLLHYSSEFFPVPEELKSLDNYCRKIKKESLAEAKNLNLVAISEMMVDICKNSDVLTGFPVTLIHNGIDSSSFKLYNKQLARQELGIAFDSKVFLFSSYNIHDLNKGLDRIIEALEQCNISNTILICIGSINMPMPDTPFPVILTGLINSQDIMSRYYSAADFFLQASYEETFSQTPLESMSCGTPVITFPVSGSKDLINEINGVVCDDFTVDALVNGIKLAMSRNYCREKIRENVINRFSYAKIAKQYIELYKSVLNKR